jgi:hypothetical protein
MNWKRGACISAVLMVSMLIAGSVSATTYYVDYSTGSDSNSGTSESTPWKHAPGMKGLTPTGSSTGDGCSANCASYTPQPGDKIILKGGTVWPFTTAPWNFTWSGSGSTSTYGCQGSGCIYIGNAVGAGLPAWNNGTVVGMWIQKDLGGWNLSSAPSISCSGGGGSGAAATAYVVPSAETNDPYVSGMLYKVVLTNTGSGYTSAPACALNGSGTATLGTDIDRAVFDLGAMQSSSPDWPLGQCGTYPDSCAPGLNIRGQDVLVSGVEVRNLEMQVVTGSGTNDEHQTMTELDADNDTFSNMFIHGLYIDCIQSGSCPSSSDAQFDAVTLFEPYDELANSVVENGDAVFLGTSTQQSNGICSTNILCGSSSFGVVTGTQTGNGPVSSHGNVEYGNYWQLRFAGNNASGTNPYLEYGDDLWLTVYGGTPNGGNAPHINSRYSQLQAPASIIAWDNMVHNQVEGTSSQIECQNGSSFTFYNEVIWDIGTGTQPYSLDLSDAGGQGGCSMTLYNDTAYDTSGLNECVNAQTGSTYMTTVTLQNLDCIPGNTTASPFWGQYSNLTVQNSTGSTSAATVQGSSVVQSSSAATSQGYVQSNAYAPTTSGSATVAFSSNSGSANLTNLCSGNLTALCEDISGNVRPSTGPWQAGAYQYGSGASSSSTTPPLAPTNLSAVVN